VATSIKRISVYSVTGVLALLALVAGYLWWTTRIERFPGLAERVNAYYNSEMNKHWNETYQYRPPAFQQSVPKQKYVVEMTKDSEGWELKSARVKYAVQDGKRIKVFGEFQETTPKGFAPVPSLSQKSLTATITDISVWENIDGIWYAWETGTRSHLSLNAGLVAPN
jgi:hypothetical protein